MKNSLRLFLYNCVFAVLLYVCYHLGVYDLVAAGDMFYLSRFGCLLIVLYGFYGGYLCFKNSLTIDKLIDERIHDPNVITKLETDFQTCAQVANWCTLLGFLGTGVGLAISMYIIGLSTDLTNTDMAKFAAAIGGAVHTTITGIIFRMYVEHQLHNNETVYNRI